MKDLFLTFLDLLNNKGEITTAQLFSSGDYSQIVMENETGKYTVSIHKESETDENGND